MNESFREGFEKTAVNFKALGNKVLRKGKQMTNQAVGVIKKNPKKAVAGAAAAGYVAAPSKKDYKFNF